MWTAKIITKSEVDQSGMIEIIISVSLDSDLKYDSVRLNCAPSDVEETVKRKLQELKEANEAASEIVVDSVITL